MSRRITVTKVAIPTPISPKMLIDTAVAIAAAAILTILFPIRMEMRNRFGFSFSSDRDADPFFPSFTRVLTLARVMEIRATSELEKKAERARQMMKSRSRR
jgi:hypothetical protein